MLAGYERGDVVHGQIVDQGLLGLGILAFIIDPGEVREVPNEVLDPVPDRRQRGGKPRRIHGIALVDVGIERDLPIPCDEQREAQLAQSEPFVLGVPALREGRALGAARQRRKKVRGIVEERIELERQVVDHLARAVGLDRFYSKPRDGIHLVPAVLTRERGGLESAEAVHGGPLRPGGPGTLGARPHGAMKRGEDEGRAQGEGPP